MHCFKENNIKCIAEEGNRRDMFLFRFVRDATHHLLEVEHRARNLQIIH